MGEIMQKSFVFPMKFLFGARGGYATKVSKATATTNVFMKISNLLGLIYTGVMPHLDNLVKFNKEMLELFSGKEAIEKKEEKWNMFETIKDLALGNNKDPNKASEGSLFRLKNEKMENENIFNRFINFMDNKFDMDLDKGAISRAGIGSFKDLNPNQIRKNM
jgi:hypothetical protein